MSDSMDVSVAMPEATLRDWRRALRLHQWSKNILIFVPLFLAHQYTDLSAIVRLAVGFLAMGLVASATYIINDLTDLEADRLHATKRDRPIASGRIGEREAMIAALCLGFIGLATGLWLNIGFGVVIVVYVAMTLAYSLQFKRKPLIDVFILGLLFTLRIMMGIIILGVVTSPWLVVFSVFFFFSLSMAKRHVEIVQAAARGETGDIRGRGYRVGDASLTLAIGMASALAAVTLLFLYVINDADRHGFYQHPIWLLGVAFLVFLWMGRIWLKSNRGELDDDPIVFALKDGPSYLVAVTIAILFVMAVL